METRYSTVNQKRRSGSNEDRRLIPYSVGGDMAFAGGFDPQSVVRWNSTLLSAELDGETVLMSLANGRYYGLDAVGSDVWRRLATPICVRDVCTELAKYYDGEAVQIEHDVLALLVQLRDEGLVEVVS